MYYNRFSPSMPIDETYDELKVALGREMAVGETVAIKDLNLDLVHNSVLYNGEVKPLGERARSVLCERLGLGRIFEVFPEETLRDLTPAINKHLAAQDGSLILKSRSGEVQGIVSERYNETPYDQVLDMLQHLNAKPVRVYQNDYNLRMQAIFEKFVITPKDGQELNMGVEMKTSDMGVGALNLNVFFYRYICENGCIMGKNAVGSFRAVHIKNFSQAEADMNKQVNTVLEQASKRILELSNNLIQTRYDQAKVVDFLARQTIGKKALAEVCSRIIMAKPANMWDVVNVLTAAGHDQDFSQSVQQVLEQSAGDLMMLAVA